MAFVLNTIGLLTTTQGSKHHYSYPILERDTSSYHPTNENSDHHQHYRSQSSSSNRLEKPESNIIDAEIIIRKDPFLKRILIVDDDPDTTLTFKVGLEECYYYYDDKRKFEVYTYNSPIIAAREFKPNFYDLLLTDIYMPDMNGFQLSEKILELDVNLRVCFISSAEVNIEALREVYPKSRSIGCFMKKPVIIWLKN